MKSTKIFVKSLAILLSILLTAFSFPMDVLADEVLGLVERLSDSSTQPTVPEKDMVELTELRTATTKHFLLEDGSYMVTQYDTVIHYPDENREWQNIDNRLSVTGSEITTSDAKIKFAKKTTGNESLFTLHDGNRKLTLSLNGWILPIIRNRYLILSPLIRKDICRSVLLRIAEDISSRHTTGKSGNG